MITMNVIWCHQLSLLIRWIPKYKVFSNFSPNSNKMRCLHAWLKRTDRLFFHIKLHMIFVCFTSKVYVDTVLKTALLVFGITFICPDYYIISKHTCLYSVNCFESFNQIVYVILNSILNYSILFSIWSFTYLNLEWHSLYFIEIHNWLSNHLSQYIIIYVWIF